MTKVCIEAVEGGYSVYQEGGNETQSTGAGGPVGMDGAAAPGQGHSMAGMPNNAAQAGARVVPADTQPQVVATVEEALQLAGSMLQGGATPEQDEASADALFNAGFNQAAKQR